MTRETILLRWSFVLALFLLGLFSCLDLGINDNALDLLPGKAVRGDIRLLQEMGLVDRVFITLSVPGKMERDMAGAKRRLQQSAARLGQLLEESGEFSFVLARLPQSSSLNYFENFRAALPLLFDGDDLEELRKRIEPEAIHARLQEDFARINSPAGIALKKQLQLDPLGLVGRLLQKLSFLRSEFSMEIVDGFFMSRDGSHCMVVAQSRHPLTDSAGALIIQDILDRSYKEALAGGVGARTIGSLPHTLANHRIIRRDLQLLLPLATVLLVLLLGLSLRNIRALVVLGVPFLAAPAAIGLTRLVHGELGGLALGFGIVLLGIAVDFSIHLYLTLTREDGSATTLLQRLRRPVFTAALTTSAVFVVLLFSQVPSHRQMATLALFGVLLAVLFAWLVIPTITGPVQKKLSESQATALPGGIRHKAPRLISALWLALLLAGVLSWPRLHYNGDLRVLDVPDQQVVADDAHFSATWGQKGKQAFIIAEGRTLAEVLDRNSLVYRFLKNNHIDTFQSLAPVLPGPATQAANLRGWTDFWQENRVEFSRQFAAKAKETGFSIRGFAPFFSWLDREPEELVPEKFTGGPLQPLILSMLKLPESAETMAQTGREDFLAMTTVTIDDGTLPVLQRLESYHEGVTVIANSKWRAEVEQLLRHDILTLSLVAGAIIVLLVGIQFRDPRAVVAVLAPVLSALSAMSVFCLVTDGELNMMHLIMGIMVIGLSVDYGIFTVCSSRSGQRATSATAVSICAASSLIGFGVLAFAGHPALHSLGITVLVGIGVAWPTALVVSPVLLDWQREG